MQVPLEFALFPRANAWLWQALCARDLYEVGRYRRNKDGNVILFPRRDRGGLLGARSRRRVRDRWL